MKKIAIFASGHGTNYEAIDDAIKAGKLDAEIVLLVVDNPNAEVIDKAKTRNTETIVVTVKQFGNKQKYEEYILSQLKQKEVEYIVLAGYMRLVTDVLLEPYDHHIINIHPALLPNYKGKDGIGQAYRAHEKRMGVTIHYVDAGMDTGSIIAQDSFEVDPSWSQDECEKRIHEIEHVLYYTTLKKLWEENK